MRLASDGTADGGTGTGYTVYSSVFLIVMVPHSIITVSLSTAILPRLSARAANGDLAGLASTLTSTLRTALAVVVPFAALLPLVARDMANVIWGHGAAADATASTRPSLALFGPGLVMFTVHYLMLRGFYSLELTRTVFFIQCAVAVTNIVGALVLVAGPAPPRPRRPWSSPTSPPTSSARPSRSVVLAPALGGLEGRTLRFLVRLALVVAGSTAVAAAVAFGLGRLWGTTRTGPSPWPAARASRSSTASPSSPSPAPSTWRGHVRDRTVTRRLGVG